LGRIAGQNDVVIGVPVTGRNHTALEKVVGFLLNTLAIPISMDRGCTGVSLIERTLKSVEATLNDQDLPFERLVDSLNLNRSLINTPVFQAMFAFQSDATPTFSFQGIACESKIINSSTTKFDLTLHLNKELDGTLQGEFEFDQSIFEPSSVVHWLDAFYMLTTALCQDPTKPIALLPITTETEKTKLIADSAGETVIIDPEFLVFTQALESQVRRTPNATAVVSNLDVMTYSELDKASNQMARYILEQGIKTDQIIGVLIDRSLEMVVSIIAIIKAGAAYLPLDINYPTPRLSYMLKDSQAVALLCSRRRLEAFNLFTADLYLPPTWVLDDVDVAKSIASKSTSILLQSELSNRVNEDNLVYVMYTSGSTGKPKGVSFLHGALGNLVKWKAATLPSDAPSVLQYSPMGFDASAQEIASALCNGSPLVLIDEESRRDSRALLKHMHTQKIAHLYAPFVVLSSLAEVRNSFDDQGWPDEVFTAGEQLQITPEIRSAFTAHPRSRLHNFYGPTEAHVVSHYSMSDNPANWTEFPPIGTPVFNTQLYILDRVLNVMPDGMEGELYIAGRGLARGYLGKPGMTAEKFIACPFSQSGARMYRTGDLARRRNGQIEYLGRIDEQVKLNGYRIEMGEIEAAVLLYFDCFSQVAVIAREVNGIKSLVTYFVLYSGQKAPERSQLRTILAKHLPEYMVPSYYVAVEALPMTPNGKLDRIALPVPQGRNSEQVYREPLTENEILLCQLFSETTGTKLVSVDDSFFAIGGHSLLAMRLISRLRSQSGIILPLRTLFEFTTPESLALNLVTQDEDDEPMLIKGGGRISETMLESD
jgi:amino acid adenylation domain-containing protein